MEQKGQRPNRTKRHITQRGEKRKQGEMVDAEYGVKKNGVVDLAFGLLGHRLSEFTAAGRSTSDGARG